MKPQFRIREALLVMALVSVCAAWWMDHRHQQQTIGEQKTVISQQTESLVEKTRLLRTYQDQATRMFFDSGATIAR